MQVFLQQALQLHQAGRLDEAEPLYRQVLAANPRDVNALHLLGALHLMRRDHAKAAEFAGKAVRLRPDFAEALNNLAVAQRELGQFAKADHSLTQALRLKPDFVDALNNLGNLRCAQHRFEEAVGVYERALSVAPNHLRSLANGALAQLGAGRLDDAAQWVQRALAAGPLPTDLALTLARVAIDAGYPRQAADLLRTADPQTPDVQYRLGEAFEALGEDCPAAEAFRRALTLQPDHHRALAALTAALRRLCDWADLPELEARLVAAGGQGLHPFASLVAPCPPEQQLAIARQWAEAVRLPPEQRLPARRQRRAGPIRVGYLSGDFREHATSYLLAEALELHDRTQVEVFGYSIGPNDDSPMRARIEKACDHFSDLETASHRVAAEAIHADQIDILIDLHVYTKLGRPQIAALRPAPVQVNWLGYPGTSGADFYDYLLGDPVATPPEHQPLYSERLVLLPDSYQPNDRARAVAEQTPPRSALGLPDDGFVFCCFNNHHKISPDTFAVWMRLLDAVPGSVLWLLAEGEAAANLRRQAGDKADRLVFASRCGLPEHLARQRQADLFLDTLPYNAHTTASDALWVGLPVLTCIGPTFAGRVAASLLTAAGAPDLITVDMAEYEARARELACDRASLAALRDRLSAGRDTSPLFDSHRFTRNLEAAYAQMFERQQAGKKPAPIIL